MNLRDEWKWLVILAVLAIAVYANSTGGEFVYDDTRQILRNSLIQNNALIGKALTSDVWAFKGDGSVVASNYWRPTFTAWHILNYRLFGASPAGWHWLNVLLHAGVTLLAFLFLRKIEFSATVAFAIALIFAVHPVHAESVAWISGSPDLLFALALLGSMWFAHSYAKSRSSKHLALTALLYAIALGAKEIGVICLPIFYFLFDRMEAPDKRKGVDNKSALLLLGAVAAAWFLIRLAILGGLSSPPEDAVGFGTAVLSVPWMFAFYLRQIFLPYWLSVNYPVEPVTSIGLSNFVFPLAVSLAALGGIYYLVKNDQRARLAAALFLLPLAPAMNAMVFTPEQIVHDRYLYLPLLGALMLLVPLAARWLNERNLLIAGGAIAAILAFQTFIYNKTWATDLTLWANARAMDASSFTAGQYANALVEAGRYDEAIKEFTDAINKKPKPRNYLGRGRTYLKKKQYAQAEQDLKTLLSLPPENQELYAIYQTYEALGIVYSEQRNYDAAVRNFTEGRAKLPMYSAAISCDLAVVLYQAGQKEQALRELEGAQVQARKELLPESKAVFMRLGMLYAELGRKIEARAALQEHLALTAGLTDSESINDRKQSAKLLETLR